MIKNIIHPAITVLLAILLFSSCTEKNDWEVDSAYNRLFRVTTMGITPDKTKAVYTWSSTPNTEYYIIEISKDSLYDDIAMGASNGSLVFGKDKQITKSPYTLAGLEGTTKYYLRIKGVSEGVESKWAYPTLFSFNTKGEQILIPVTAQDVTDKSVTLRWDADGIPVSHIILSYTENQIPTEKRVDLSEQDIANSQSFIDGLLDATTYTASIYNGANKRGEIPFRTNESIPHEGVIHTLTGSEDIVAYLATIPESDVTLVLPEGSAFETSWVNELSEPQTTFRLPDHITSLTFWGKEGATQAKITTTSIKLSAGTTKLKFKNVELKGKASNADYVINESVYRPISEVSFTGCTINNFRGVLRMQNDLNNSNISKITFSDCIIHTIESYGVINGAQNTLFGDIVFENSTLYDLKEVFVVMKSKPSSISLKNCTFYNTIKTAKYYFDMKNGEISCLPDNFKIEKCIFGKNYGLKTDETVRATNPKLSTEFVSESYATSDCLFNTGYPLTGVISYDKLSSDLFGDPDKGDFTIKDSNFAGKSTAGDPRWIK